MENNDHVHEILKYTFSLINITLHETKILFLAFYVKILKHAIS